MRAQAPFQEMSAVCSEMEEECEDGTHWDSSLWSVMEPASWWVLH